MVIANSGALPTTGVDLQMLIDIRIVEHVLSEVCSKYAETFRTLINVIIIMIIK